MSVADSPVTQCARALAHVVLLADGGERPLLRLQQTGLHLARRALGSRGGIDDRHRVAVRGAAHDVARDGGLAAADAFDGHLVAHAVMYQRHLLALFPRGRERRAALAQFQCARHAALADADGGREWYASPRRLLRGLLLGGLGCQTVVVLAAGGQGQCQRRRHE